MCIFCCVGFCDHIPRLIRKIRARICCVLFRDDMALQPYSGVIIPLPHTQRPPHLAVSWWANLSTMILPPRMTFPQRDFKSIRLFQARASSRTKDSICIEKVKKKRGKGNAQCQGFAGYHWPTTNRAVIRIKYQSHVRVDNAVARVRTYH